MQKTKTLLAAAILGLIALAGKSQAQTPSPTPNPNAGTYLDTSLSLNQRLVLADAVLSTGSGVDGAASFMLSLHPRAPMLALYPAFDAQVLADPSLSGTIADPVNIARVYYDAVNFKLDTITATADKIAFLQPLLSSTIWQPNAVIAFNINQVYVHLVYLHAADQFAAADYADTITTLAPVLGQRGTEAVDLTFKAKVALRSSDVLSWGKLEYEIADFPHTQAGIDAVSSAYRALDMNLVRAQAFIQYQKDGQGTNPLAGVVLPQVTFTPVTFLYGVAALNAGIAGGDNVAALKIAAAAFASAPSGAPLNQATELVSQWLRNIDGNLVRANAFATAQNQGQPFSIAELQQ